MKKFFKYTMTMALAVLALTSCSNSEYKYDGPGQWNANEGYAQVQFAKTSLSVELAPTDPAQTTIQLTRKNTTGSAVVNFDIETNTDDVFTVTPATFADGEETATAVVSFPNAAIGKEYILKLVITDPNMASLYSTSNGCTLSVMRVKWNDAGFIYTDAAKTQKLEGWASYTDVVCGSWFGGQNLTFATRLQERDDKPGYFRLVNTYDYHYPYNDPTQEPGTSWQGAGVTREDCFDYTKDYYIFIDATDPKKVFIPKACDLGSDWGYGDFYIWSLAGYYLNKDDEESAAPYYGTYENGAITFPKDALLRAMANYNGGGFYQISPGTDFKLVIDPDKAPYTAQVSDYIFNSKGLVFSGLFTSNKLKTEKSDVMLIKGAANPEVEAANKGCYSRFEEKYGEPYLIVSPYEAGKHLLFCVNAAGKVVIPDEVANQPIGIQAMGEDVYAHINGGASTFSESEVVLNITFQNEKGDVVYGETNEILANITWTQVGTGTYTYTAWSRLAGEDPGYKIYQRDDKPEYFKIEEWGDGVDFIFTWNKTTNKCTVPVQAEGYVHPDYGKIYVSDFPYYGEFVGDSYSYDDFPCVYDSESSTFSFFLIYYISNGGYFGYGMETLKVDWDNASSAPRASRSAKRSQNIGQIKTDLASSKKSSFGFGKGIKRPSIKSMKIVSPKGAPVFE